MGEKMSCISAQAVPKAPYISAPRAALPPAKFCTSIGKTGIIMPKASMSMSTVTKMKANAALRGGFIAAPTENPVDSRTGLLIRAPFRYRSHGVFNVLVGTQGRVGIDDLAGRRNDIRSAVGVR